MPSEVFLIAQVNADVLQDLEITAGRILAGLCVLSALAGSLAMLTAWARRMGQGIPPLPLAARKPLSVPVLLLLGGLVLTIAMATMVASPSDIDPDQVTSTDSADTDDEVVDADLTEDVDVTPEVAAGDADMFREMLVGTLSMNLTLFLLFGTVILLAQQGTSRRPSSSHDVTSGSAQDAAPTPPAFAQFGDLDAPPVGTLSNAFGHQDNALISLPLSDAAAAAQDQRGTPDEPLPGLLSLPEPERWRFAQELRFALETVLVAYLPTAAVRVVMVSLLPEAPSHPFLEMMNDGVDWGIMLLIALMAVVVAPLVEELLYRVTILGGMMQQGWLVPGWIVSSLLFGFAHGFPDSIALLPLAFAIGYAYMQRRSYRTVMLIHLLFNGFNMVIAGVSLI